MNDEKDLGSRVESSAVAPERLDLPRSPHRVSSQRWQSIETAPKDGTQVWVWDAERGSNPALYLSDGETWVITYDDAEIQPTHWMPLPQAPTKDSQS